MQASDVLTECFERIQGLVHGVVSGLDDAAQLWRPDRQANPIAWLVWHLTRIQDDHLAGITGDQQVWEAGAWAPRFGLPAGAMDLGFGHTAQQVGAVQPEAPSVLTEYHDQVAERTQQYLTGIEARELDRVVDRSWDPPVTAGVRLVSVVGDCLQHLGQAAYVRGMWERRS
jgi:uncharacterized damage-inducible protein DinB